MSEPKNLSAEYSHTKGLVTVRHRRFPSFVAMQESLPFPRRRITHCYRNDIARVGMMIDQISGGPARLKSPGLAGHPHQVRLAAHQWPDSPGLFKPYRVLKLEISQGMPGT